MNKFRFALPLLAAMLVVPAMAQDDPAAKIRLQGDAILNKVYMLDIYDYLLPVLLTPAQIKELLPMIEVARSEERELAQGELKAMQDLEKKVDVALKEASDNDVVPPQELKDEAQKVAAAIRVMRQSLALKHTVLIHEKMKTLLNAGQLKAAAGTIPVRIPEGVEPPTEDERVQEWIRRTLLDPLSYPILVERAKR